MQEAGRRKETRGTDSTAYFYRLHSLFLSPPAASVKPSKLLSSTSEARGSSSGFLGEDLQLLGSRRGTRPVGCPLPWQQWAG